MKTPLLVWRARARLLFRALLAVGFIIQSYEFLQMYLRYPSMLQLSVEQPYEVELPAFTVCNLNEVRATPYCNKYPHLCGTPDTVPDFCDKYPEYCRLVNNSQKSVPVIDVFNYNLSRYEQQTFGHQWDNMVVSCVIQIDDKEVNCEERPKLVPALSHSTRVPYNCFMMYSLYEEPYKKPKKVPISTVIRLHLNVEVSEYHPSHLSRGMQISIHSPYHLPSPTSDGQLLNLGTIYRFYLRLTEQNLLPYPYKSNCTDYLTEWTKNGGRGPVTMNMCIEKCKLDKSLAMYGCVDPRIDYPNNFTLCTVDMPGFQKKSREECHGHCSMSCSLRRYEFQVQEANSEGNRQSCLNATDLTCAILVQIFMENLEITTFAYKPTFEAVGILSWIGGYVGLWLGISLLHVYDFIEKWAFRLVAVVRKKYFKKKVLPKKKFYVEPYKKRRW